MSKLRVRPILRSQKLCVKRHHANVNKQPYKKGAGRPSAAYSRVPNDDPRAKSPRHLQDAGKGDCSGCDCGVRLRSNAEISVMTSPIGKG